MSAAVSVVFVPGFVAVAVLILGLLWIVSKRRPPEPRITSTAATTAAARPLTASDAHAIYAHFLATLGWTLFWFSGIGGAAGVILYNSTDNRLDNPLVIVAVVTWGSLGAALALASRAELRKLRP